MMEVLVTFLKISFAIMANLYNSWIIFSSSMIMPNQAAMDDPMAADFCPESLTCRTALDVAVTGISSISNIDQDSSACVRAKFLPSFLKHFH
jgi:hypothetical protein